MRNFLTSGQGNKESDIMMIGEYPAKTDFKNNTFFNYYENFKNIVNQTLEFEGTKYTFDDFYCTYAVKKYIPSEKGLTYVDFLSYTKTDQNDFLEILAKEINEVQPKVIICFGSNIAKLLTKKTLAQSADKVQNIEKFSESLEYIPKVVTCYSGSYIENQFKMYSNTKPLETFSRAIDKCFYVAQGNESALEINYTQSKLIESVEMFDTLMGYVEQTGIASFDYETTGLEWYDKELFCTVLSISFQIGSSYIIPLYHREPIFETDDNGEVIEKGGKYVVLDTKDPIFSDEVVQYFISELERRVFNNPEVIKIAHNLKFDMHWNKVNGIHKYAGRFNDTMLMSHIMNELTPNDLKDLTREYFYKYSNYEEALKKYHYRATPLKILSVYAGIDTDITLRLWVMFEQMLINDDPEHLLYILYRNLTMPAWFALFEAEHHGAKIDKPFLLKAIEEADEILQRKLTKLRSFREVKKFEAYTEKDKRKQAIADATKKLEDRKALVSKKIDEQTQKATIAHATALDELNVMNPTEEDKKSKRSAYSKQLTKVARANRKLQELAKKKLESDQDKYVKQYTEDLRQTKLGANVVYSGINFRSPVQLAELLYTPAGLGLPPKEIFEKGEYVQDKSTGADYLKQFDHPFITALFEYRSVYKMVSTYYNGILKRLDANDYLHTSFKLNGTVSGRLSSVNPNLQNIPSRSKIDDPDTVKCLKRVKQFFTVKSDDYYIMQFDYSQAELRLVANFSRDETMMSTYLQGIDLHTMTASKLSGTDYDSFLEMEEGYRKKQRNNAKGANFGLVYDISIEGYMEYCKNTFNLVLSYKEANEHYDKFFEAYPTLKQWHAKYIAMGKRDGFVRTLFGRKRRLPNINNQSQFYLQSEDIRYAINSPIQGTGGEYTLFSIAILRHRLPKEVIFFNTVHDSIFYYIPKHLLEYTLPIIVDACEHPPIEDFFYIEPQPVMMKIDLEISDKSWGDLEEFEAENYFN